MSERLELPIFESESAAAGCSDDPLMRIVAIASDPTDRSNLAEDHDTVLYSRMMASFPR